MRESEGGCMERQAARESLTDRGRQKEMQITKYRIQRWCVDDGEGWKPQALDNLSSEIKPVGCPGMVMSLSVNINLSY